MLDDDIKLLREALAAGPTPGEWRLEQGACLYLRADGHSGAMAELRSRLDYAGMNPVVAQTREANARYIAAASPDRIARLLEQVERLRTALRQIADEFPAGEARKLYSGPTETLDRIRVCARAAMGKGAGND